MTTYTEARDLMFARVQDTWDANAATYFGTVPALLFVGSGQKSPQPGDDPYGRVSERLALERQAAFGAPFAGDRSSYRSVGILIIEIWSPVALPDLEPQAREFAQVVRNAFRGYSAGGKMEFRDQTVQTPENEPNWYRFNVRVEYEFRETA
jgi:hypothetical protein